MITKTTRFVAIDRERTTKYCRVSGAFRKDALISGHGSASQGFVIVPGDVFLKYDGHSRAASAGFVVHPPAVFC